MKIQIDQIPDSGLNLSEKYQPSALDLNRADIKFTEPINLSAKITKGVNVISVELAITATMHLNCSRCLEEFAAPLSCGTKLNLSIEDRKEIDITNNLREELILRYPLKSLCRPDCQGLCPICGKNLNKGKCRCKHVIPKRKELRWHIQRDVTQRQDAIKEEHTTS